MFNDKLIFSSQIQTLLRSIKIKALCSVSTNIIFSFENKNNTNRHYINTTMFLCLLWIWRHVLGKHMDPSSNKRGPEIKLQNTKSVSGFKGSCSDLASLTHLDIFFSFSDVVLSSSEEGHHCPALTEIPKCYRGSLRNDQNCCTVTHLMRLKVRQLWHRGELRTEPAGSYYTIPVNVSASTIILSPTKPNDHSCK